MALDKSKRLQALTDWARGITRAQGIDIAPGSSLASASDDASFRRYFRATLVDGTTRIFVDAPPPMEDSRPFVRIAKMLLVAGLDVPVVFEVDYENGFMMLTDLGNELYFHRLAAGDGAEIEARYRQAIRAINVMQSVPAEGLPRYDETLLRTEMSLFTDWFLAKQVAISLDNAERQLIEDVFALMVRSALEQPVAFVHRDYHCRNLMVLGDSETAGPGIIDFQDAVAGPVTYDLVSLLKDCYHRFPARQRDAWLEAFRETWCENAGESVDPATFRRWFDFMGFQRHLKCAGIFSRLNLRDGKPRYLGDIPLVVDYLVEVASDYPELAAFGTFLGERVLPALGALASR